MVRGARVLFRVTDSAGELCALARKGAEAPPQRCEFASGESLDPKEEGLIMKAAAQAKDWDAFVFKLGLEGLELREGMNLKLPFGKL